MNLCAPLAAAISAYVRGRTTPGEPRPTPDLSSITSQRQMTAGQCSEVIDCYKAGATVRALATDYGLHRTMVSGHLDAAGVAIRTNRILDERVDRAPEF